jgi:hypothetical protein
MLKLISALVITFSHPIPSNFPNTYIAQARVSETSPSVTTPQSGSFGTSGVSINSCDMFNKAWEGKILEIGGRQTGSVEQIGYKADGRYCWVVKKGGKQTNVTLNTKEKLLLFTPEWGDLIIQIQVIQRDGSFTVFSSALKDFERNRERLEINGKLRVTFFSQ